MRAEGELLDLYLKSVQENSAYKKLKNKAKRKIKSEIKLTSERLF